MLYPFVRPLNTLIISEPLLVDFNIVMLERNKKSYSKGNKYILHVLLCSIAKYFYELSHIRYSHVLSDTSTFSLLTRLSVAEQPTSSSKMLVLSFIVYGFIPQ